MRNTSKPVSISKKIVSRPVAEMTSTIGPAEIVRPSVLVRVDWINVYFSVHLSAFIAPCLFVYFIQLCAIFSFVRSFHRKALAYSSETRLLCIGLGWSLGQVLCSNGHLLLRGQPTTGYQVSIHCAT